MIRRYGTQSVMKVGLEQPIMREVLDKLMTSVESDALTESVTEDSADDQQITRRLPVRRAKKRLKRSKGKTVSKTMNRRVARPSESGQGDGATLAGGEKENLIPNTSDAIGRFDHNGNKVEEKCTDFGGY